MRIVNPTFGLPDEAETMIERVGTGAADWGKDPIAIISNSKPNARELLEGVRDAMSAFRQVDNIDYHFKDSAAQPAPDALIELVAKNYKGAILALAD